MMCHVVHVYMTNEYHTLSQNSKYVTVINLSCMYIEYVKLRCSCLQNET